VYFGEYEYRIDEKGRVPIPPKFRSELKGDSIMLAPGLERCLNVYAYVEWKKLAATLTTGPFTQSKLRRLNRATFATAFNIKLDGQGRVIVPAPLREYAGIEDEVVIAGVNNYFEIWNKQQWELEKATSQEEAWQIIESLERR
jgi:MraZ protein